MRSPLLRAPIAALALLPLLAAPAEAGPLDEARQAVEARRWSDAVAAYGRVLEADPGHREAALGLATAATKGAVVDAYLRAEEGLLRLLQDREGDREARLALGNLYLAMAVAKEDDQSRRFTFEDARLQFQQLVDEDAADEAATVGLARAHYEMADFDTALQVIDDFLAENQSAGPALYWKGQVFYLRGLDAYRAAGAVDDATRSLLQRAAGAYEAGLRADEGDYDGWMQLGYCAHYLGETERAREAYEKAMDLDAESHYPLRGIEAIYLYRQDEYGGVLEELRRTHPDNVAIHWFIGYRHLVRSEFEAAVQSLERYAGSTSEPGVVWVYLGQAHEGQGNGSEAEEAFRRALEADPEDEFAAGRLERRILDRYGAASQESPEGVRALVRAYEPLLALAPQNALIRNNLAFALRGGVDRSRGDVRSVSVPRAWRDALAQCVRYYVEASDRVESRLVGSLQQIPYERRYEYAGILNDTGLMLQYYPSVVDLERAEAYYLRALEITDDGHTDAYGNLLKIYEGAGRWQEAYDLAADCAESLRQRDGGADETGRAHARGAMASIARDRDVETD